MKFLTILLLSLSITLLPTDDALPATPEALTDREILSHDLQTSDVRHLRLKLYPNMRKFYPEYANLDETTLRKCDECDNLLDILTNRNSLTVFTKSEKAQLLALIVKGVPLIVKGATLVLREEIEPNNNKIKELETDFENLTDQANIIRTAADDRLVCQLVDQYATEYVACKQLAQDIRAKFEKDSENDRKDAAQKIENDRVTAKEILTQDTKNINSQDAGIKKTLRALQKNPTHNNSACLPDIERFIAMYTKDEAWLKNNKYTYYNCLTGGSCSQESQNQAQEIVEEFRTEITEQFAERYFTCKKLSESLPETQDDQKK